MNKNWKETAIGLSIGMTVGIIMTMFAFFIFNIWHLLPPFQKSGLFYATIIIWVGIGMSSALYYKPLRCATYRNIAYSVGLIATISLLNYAYNILAHTLPYSSLATVKITALVVIGSSIGLIIKILAESKEARGKQIIQQ